TTKVWRRLPAKIEPGLEENTIQRETSRAKPAKSRPLTCQPERSISDQAVSLSLRRLWPLENPRLWSRFWERKWNMGGLSAPRFPRGRGRSFRAAILPRFHRGDKRNRENGLFKRS